LPPRTRRADGRRAKLGLLEDGLQAGQIRGSEDEAVSGRDVDEIEVDAGPRHLASEIGEDARTIFDVDDDHLALATDGEVRQGQRVLGSLGMRNEDVQLDVVVASQAGRRREVDARVADRRGDPGERAGLVLDLDDQVEWNRTCSPESVSMTISRRG
jgi:hypothetical protein